MPRSFQLLLTSAALTALCACATPASRPPAAAALAPPGTDRTTVYGLYLAGQTALASGDSPAAAALFTRAQAAKPDAIFIKDRLFISALMSGDVPKAAALAADPAGGALTDPSLGSLVQGVEALSQGRNADAYAKLAQQQQAIGAVALLKPWAAAGAGRRVDALAMPDGGDRLLRLVASIDQAMLFERAHRYSEAETAFKALLVDKSARGLVAEPFGAFLERRGRRAEAIALYDQALEDNPGERQLTAARTRAAAKKAAPAMLTVREGAADALMIPAAATLADKQEEMGLIYLRLILRLDPTREDALVLAGEVLESLGDIPSAREAYLKVPPKSLRYPDARTRLALSYQADDKATALKIARETVAARPDSDMARLTLADLLRSDDQFEESTKVLDPLIASMGTRADWQIYYRRAVALERLNRWPDAQRDLDKALQLKPDQPEVLNYLGYSWVNRGVKVKDGMAMIQKAVDAQPEEGAFVDSLGWAYYRLSDFKNAVATLERAVSLEAGDAEINDHLGDAYWRVGRHDEARFQWQAVLTMKPDAEVKARAEAKLASAEGPDAVVGAAPVQTP